MVYNDILGIFSIRGVGVFYVAGRGLVVLGSLLLNACARLEMVGAFQQGWRIFHEQEVEAPAQRKSEVQLLGRPSSHRFLIDREISVNMGSNISLFTASGGHMNIPQTAAG